MTGTYSPITQFALAVEKISSEVPKDFRLRQNYPNPFNPSTTIEFDVPVTSKINVTVYNMMGQSIETLENKVHGPGTYSLRWNVGNLPSGIYFLRFSSDKYIETIKMNLVK